MLHWLSEKNVIVATDALQVILACPKPIISLHFDRSAPGSKRTVALRVPGVHAASPNCCSLTTFASSNPNGDAADIATGDGASAACGDGAAVYGAGAGDTDGEGAARVGGAGDTDGEGAARGRRDACVGGCVDAGVGAGVVGAGVGVAALSVPFWTELF